MRGNPTLERYQMRESPWLSAMFEAAGKREYSLPFSIVSQQEMDHRSCGVTVYSLPSSRGTLTPVHESLGTISLTAASLEFAHPWVLAAMAAALLPLLLRPLARRRNRHVPTWTTVLQCLALAAIVVALAGPQAPLDRQADRPWLVLQDASASMRQQSGPSWPAGTPQEEYCFAASVQACPTSPSGLGAEFTGQTLVAPALRLAASPDRFAGVVLFSDGQFQDDWPAAAAALGDAHVAVLILPATTPPADARIADMNVIQSPEGRRAEIRVTVASNVRTHRTLIVRRTDGAAPLMERSLDMLDGDVVTVVANDANLANHLASYRAELSPADAFPENDAATAIAPPAQRRIAIVTDSPLPTLNLNATIDIISTTKLPADPLAWQAYDAVLAVDSDGHALAAAGDALAKYVQSGGGLVLLGTGPHGSPADANAPLNRVLPLLTNPFQRRPMKLIVALDASGSMAQSTALPGRPTQPKYAVAADAVLSLQSHLTADDRLAVLVFADRVRRVYDSGDKPADFAALKLALEAVSPAGGTSVLPALQDAAAKPELNGRTGLLLLLTDLQTEDFDAAAMAAKLKQAGLALSVVAVAGGQEQGKTYPLERLATAMQGPLVRTQTMQGLAEVFAQFLRQGRGDAIHHGRFALQWVGPTFGLQLSPPTVTEYFLSAAQEGSMLALAEGDPVIATRQAALGRTVAFAVPLTPTANAPLRTWPRWPQLLQSAVAWAARPTASGDFSATVTRHGNELHVDLVGQSPTGPVNIPEPMLSLMIIQGAQAIVHRFAISQTGPGRYETTIPAPSGASAIRIDDPNGHVLWRGLLPTVAGDEFQRVGANWDNLHKLAELTGGRITTPEELPSILRQERQSYLTPLWWVPAILALILMLTEWSLTRVRRGT